jgi:hypothetical protein
MTDESNACTHQPAAANPARRPAGGAIHFAGQDPETGERIRFDPTRDVAYLLPRVLKGIEAGLAEDALPPAEKARLKAAGLTAKDMADTHAKFLLFFTAALDVDIKTPPLAMRACGFFSAPPVCQEIILRAVALGLLGACWAGLRSSTMQGECPPIVSNFRARAAELMASQGYKVGEPRGWFRQALSAAWRYVWLGR